MTPAEMAARLRAKGYRLTTSRIAFGAAIEETGTFIRTPEAHVERVERAVLRIFAEEVAAEMRKQEGGGG